MNLSVHEFRKSVSILRSYGQKSSVLFFGSQCRINMMSSLNYQRMKTDRWTDKFPLCLALLQKKMKSNYKQLVRFLSDANKISAGCML